MAERTRPVEDFEQKFIFRNVKLFKNETLGTGSYGAVCKAKCDQLICAAKLLYPVLLQIQTPDPGKEHRQPFSRFEQECQFLSRINHPNIVQYLGTYRDPETNAPVLLMELMDESLTHFLESSPGDIPYHIQVNLSQDIAQALAFLHANGIIHRDLSSNNVLLIAGSRAKVSDFGMSKFTVLGATHFTTMTQCPGTPAFMSPEALDEPPVYTEKLDVFSVGVILVQIITRQFPAPGDRFLVEEFPDRRNPDRLIKARVLIPEVERRQSHISLIESTHPLLSIALECLKDEAVERPSSQQLCQSLDALKEEVKYGENIRQDTNQLLKKQVQEKDQQMQSLGQNLRVLQEERDELVREKDHQGYLLLVKDQDIQVLQKDKDELLQENDQLLRAKNYDLKVLQGQKDEQVQKEDQQMQAKILKIQTLQHEVEAKECQLKERNKQLVSSEKTTDTLQCTIIQRDREITEARQLTSTLQQTISERDTELTALRGSLANKDCEGQTYSTGGQVAQKTLDERLTISWKILPDIPRVAFDCLSTAIGEKAYFKSGKFIWEFNSTDGKWSRLPKRLSYDYYALVGIENELTTVGGLFENWFGNSKRLKQSIQLH